MSRQDGSLAGKVAVITGGGNGIGRGIALALARRRCGLALVDIDPEGLAETRRLLEPLGVAISLHPDDVADPATPARLLEAVLAAHGGVDILVNNAGVAALGTFEEMSQADFEWLIEVNFLAVTRLARAFLPVLRARPRAHLVNVSSLFGLLAPPTQTAYSASKFAVRGFSESLRAELSASAVRVMAVYPGGIATAIARNARLPSSGDVQRRAADRDRFERRLRIPPDRAGERIVRAMLRESPSVLVGRDARIGALAARLTPRLMAWLLARPAR